MPQERLSMRKIQEIIRLKWESGLSPGQDLRQPSDHLELLDIACHSE